MKYVSIDIETTGLNPNRCQVIEIAAVVDDTDVVLSAIETLPTFHCYVEHNTIVGESYALSMHSRIFEIISGRRGVSEQPVWCARTAAVRLMTFLNLHFAGGVQVAGKNFASFDLRFLRRIEGFEVSRLHHRYLDPASMLARHDDVKLPSTEECLERCGLPASVLHTAVEDARDVIRMVRHAFGVKPHGEAACPPP